MNERIRELADKAIEDMPGAWNIPDEFCKKFAELIVRECAKAVEYSIWHLPRGYKAVDQAAFVKKHFGVEE